MLFVHSFTRYSSLGTEPPKLRGFSLYLYRGNPIYQRIDIGQDVNFPGKKVPGFYFFIIYFNNINNLIINLFFVFHSRFYCYLDALQAFTCS